MTRRKKRKMKDWHKVLAFVIVLLTAWTLFQEAIQNGFVLLDKIKERWHLVHKNRSSLQEYQLIIEAKFSALEERLDLQERKLKDTRSKVVGYKKVLEEELEEPKRKRRKKFIGIF